MSSVQEKAGSLVRNVLAAMDLALEVEIVDTPDAIRIEISGAGGETLLKRKGEPLPLARLELKQELMTDYREFMPQVKPDEGRRIRGEQEIIVNYEPERSIETLPDLVADPTDRARLVELLTRLLADERVQRLGATPEQLAMLARIRKVLGLPATAPGETATLKRVA